MQNVNYLDKKKAKRIAGILTSKYQYPGDWQDVQQDVAFWQLRHPEWAQERAIKMTVAMTKWRTRRAAMASVFIDHGRDEDGEQQTIELVGDDLLGKIDDFEANQRWRWDDATAHLALGRTVEAHLADMQDKFINRTDRRLRQVLQSQAEKLHRLATGQEPDLFSGRAY